MCRRGRQLVWGHASPYKAWELNKSHQLWSYERDFSDRTLILLIRLRGVNIKLDAICYLKLHISSLLRKHCWTVCELGRLATSKISSVRWSAVQKMLHRRSDGRVSPLASGKVSTWDDDWHNLQPSVARYPNLCHCDISCVYLASIIDINLCFYQEAAVVST